MTGKTGEEAGRGAAGPDTAVPAHPGPEGAPPARSTVEGPGEEAAPERVSLVRTDRPAPAEPAAPHPEVPAAGSHVSVDEPLLAARVHRPSDLIRFLAGLLGVIAVFVLANIAQNTTTGIENDITVGATKVPGFLTTVVGLVSSVAVLVVPVAFAVERLIKRDGLRVADGVLAAVLAHGLSLGIDLWVAEAASDNIRSALTRIAQPGGGLTDPVHGYLAPVIAYMTAVGMASRPRWRVALWAVVVLSGGTELLSGYTTPLSLVLTVLLGWTVAYGTLYAIGSPNVRPTGHTLLAGLRKVGFAPVSAHRAPDAPGGARRYYVVQGDGVPLDVHVIDREQQASGFFYRLWRQLQLRSVSVRRSPQSLRGALEQEALIAYAATASGARAPHLVATSELGPDAAILVYEHTEGRTLDQLPDEEATDGLMTDLWESVKALHDRRIAHRRLTGESLLRTDDGSGRLVNLSGGDIAAGDLALRMDVAQLLTTFALRTGPERAVAAAAGVLGPRRVAASLPLLQPVGLSRSTRLELRQSNRARRAAARAAADARVAAEEITQAEADEELADGTRYDLLARIREQVLEMVPEAPIAPVRLQRLRPRTLISIVAGAMAVYLLFSSLGHVRPAELLGEADWGWALGAVGASALSYVAAAMSLTGFVPERLSFGKAVLAQVAGSFVKLVAPAAVGGVALNARFLQRAGVRPVQAAASVGASQLAGLGCHILLLLAFGYVAGNEQTQDLTPSRTVIAGLLTVAVLILVVAAIPPMRRWLMARLRPLLTGVIPRMLDLVQRPSRLVTGFGGTILLTIAFVTCLNLSLRAFGGELSFAATAVVFLAGNAVGSAIPTPGGIGAIEAALTGGLTAAGVASPTAFSAVLLFRLLTFWLPVLPGWGCFAYLQRKKAL
ncbi:flippase-like domain-containing protein [Streptacidiphilus sp. ASG 303]|uniref:lysylphosphatidylglycerol synthase transmembrane domain-containing protein n=1 Tax=Streptacidiphilus sp. ASG 303 TaxID=2896847 RepID=UPI001E61A71E|nr:lysylphosphatidylglycerol synthase transmembrane domain-containing protein [Streptacidiphilus sp. ASG 303]MCD0482809.1 flippase-like domain-containing protein [Streptacidiphilus sp. ASG 303]